MSGQKSNPKVRVYPEKFNIKNFPKTFSRGFYVCWFYICWSTLKNLTLRIFPKLFPGGSIYVGTTSFNFHNSGEKPHRCTMCEFSSITTSQLKVHMMEMHTGEKPFKCNQCNYPFAQSGNLQRHMRTHSGERPFQCNKCSKAYIQKRDLTRHSRIHMA